MVVMFPLGVVNVFQCDKNLADNYDFPKAKFQRSHAGRTAIIRGVLATGNIAAWQQAGPSLRVRSHETRKKRNSQDLAWQRAKEILPPYHPEQF